eukprot:gb/GEZN01026852.1/.p1 GENE.gb/GEZN01026852.1/~~gb/GEZN01026852.1/.p1  ORF type:complete len:143 (-),score=10.19 gb/GEZN01026852.1/:87-458(-)
MSCMEEGSGWSRDCNEAGVALPNVSFPLTMSSLLAKPSSNTRGQNECETVPSVASLAVWDDDLDMTMYSESRRVDKQPHVPSVRNGEKGWMIVNDDSPNDGESEEFSDPSIRRKRPAEKCLVQ